VGHGWGRIAVSKATGPRNAPCRAWTLGNHELPGPQARSGAPGGRFSVARSGRLRTNVERIFKDNAWAAWHGEHSCMAWPLLFRSADAEARRHMVVRPSDAQLPALQWMQVQSWAFPAPLRQPCLCH
jgi:hypothetical protein